MQQAGADALVVHARKAWLKGLSPRENRERASARLRSGLSAESRASGSDDRLNGGIGTLEEAQRASGRMWTA